MNFESFSSILTGKQILRNEPMSRHTTFGIGGPADWFLLPYTKEELQSVFHRVQQEGVPCFILGGGANLLVRDKGIRGVVISTKRLRKLYRTGETITAEAGVPTAQAAQFAGREGLSGMEFAGGIPGTVGGAAFMNAGAYGGDMGKLIVSIETCGSGGMFHTYGREELGYAYRHSLFMERPEVIVSVTLSLTPGIREDIEAEMAALNARRREKQPLEFRSAGSTFKRPEGHFTGAMIEALGLKGFSVGDAAVSDKHAGFLINKGKATCADMLALMAEVERRVRDGYGVELEPEVQIVGEK